MMPIDDSDSLGGGRTVDDDNTIRGPKKNLSTDSTRCRSCSKRCALSMMKRKGNEHVVSSNCSFLGLPVYKTGGWACDSDVSAVGRTSLPDVDSSGVAEA